LLEIDAPSYPLADAFPTDKLPDGAKKNREISLPVRKKRKMM